MRLSEFYLKTQTPMLLDPDIDVTGILEVRFSTEDDTQAIIDFYRNNKSPLITPKSDKLIEEQAKNNKACLMSLIDINTGQRTPVHVSMRYDFGERPDELTHVKFGSQIARIPRDNEEFMNIKGYDFGRKSALFQMFLGAFLTDKVKDFAFQAVYNNNENNLRIVSNEKGRRLFTEFKDEKIKERFKEHAVSNMPDCTFFKTETEQLRMQALAMHNLIKNPIVEQVIQGRKTGQKLLFTFPSLEDCYQNKKKTGREMKRFIELIASPYALEQNCFDNNKTYQESFNAIALMAAGFSQVEHEIKSKNTASIIDLLKNKVTNQLSKNGNLGQLPILCPIQ